MKMIWYPPFLRRLKNFYQKERSKKGKIEDFEYMLCLMGSEEPLEGNVTIGQLYQQFNHKFLRIYLCTKAKYCCDSELLNATYEPFLPCTSSTAESSRHKSSSILSVGTSTPVKRPVSTTSSFTCSDLPNRSRPQATPASQASGLPQKSTAVD